ncbi:hypothetical protein Droror1_Dr00023894 [Drosera rotundifolia]
MKSMKNYGAMKCVDGIEEAVLRNQMETLNTILVSINRTIVADLGALQQLLVDQPNIPREEGPSLRLLSIPSQTFSSRSATFASSPPVLLAFSSRPQLLAVPVSHPAASLISPSGCKFNDDNGGEWVVKGDEWCALSDGGYGWRMGY